MFGESTGISTADRRADRRRADRRVEEVYLTDYETYDDVLAGVPRFIDAVYNEKRMHSSLGYWSPDEYERLWETGELEKLGIDPSFKLKGKPSN